MPAPNLSADDVRNILNEIEIINIGEPIRGGQKLVLPIETSDNLYIAKFIEITPNKMIGGEGDEDVFEDNSLGRLRREIEILKICECDNLVKLAPFGLNHIKYNNKFLFYYVEEVVNGVDLSILHNQDYSFSVEEIIDFGLCINNAISALWEHKIIHRDIKPQNIIYDQTMRKFVLIDPGIAFDLNDVSYTQVGCVAGTMCFMSPEQLKPSERRSLDFRSDHFLMGLCMYMMATATHPFYLGASTPMEVHYNILHNKHESAINLNKNMPKGLSLLIDRLLSKEPHLRYRNCITLGQELLKAKDDFLQITGETI